MTATNRVDPPSASALDTNAATAVQKNLVIVGATGMVGGYAVRYALEHPAVGGVTAIGRRKLGISHPKLKDVFHQDFDDCSALAEVLTDQHAGIFCLGAYTGVVSDTELRTITVDYTIEFARVLHGSSPGAVFAFLSGSGADPTGQSRLAFARYKGHYGVLPRTCFGVRESRTAPYGRPREDRNGELRYFNSYVRLTQT